jgi:hypothetical protein
MKKERNRGGTTRDRMIEIKETKKERHFNVETVIMRGCTWMKP